MVERLADQLAAGAIDVREAVSLASVPDEVRGFGDIKDVPMDSAVERLRAYLAAVDSLMSDASQPT